MAERITTIIDQEKCTGCGLCVEVCPHPSKPIWIAGRSGETSRNARG